MASPSDAPKFPKAIPNPLVTSAGQEEEKTDPGLVARVAPQAQTTPPPSATPSPSLAPAAASTATPAPAPTAPQSTSRMPSLGILDPLMKDSSITEIMVNDMRNVIVEKDGQLLATTIMFGGIDELNRLTRSILDITGRILSPESPYVDVALPDGSRVNIIAPPLTLYGPCITIRKFPTRRFSLQDLINEGSVDQRMGYFLNAAVLGQLNILIAGGTGSGKTTLLNALVSTIPKRERMVTIEDTPELSMDHPNCVRLQTKLQTPTSLPVTARDLVANALRMRPDRIIVGECRRSEAFDMLQAMNTGHLGSMTTIHANSPRDALSRLETLCMLAGSDLPLVAFRKQMCSALDLIVQIKRFKNGKRKVVSISEVTGIEGDIITLMDIFVEEDGVFRATGLVPTFVEDLREHNVEFPQNFFER